jgi:hypothetical protein
LLGFASRPLPSVTAVDFLAAVTGLLVVALQIAYLPVLYAAFSRREILVTTLQSRAGSPAWGPEILARHQLVNIVDNLRFCGPGWSACWRSSTRPPGVQRRGAVRDPPLPARLEVTPYRPIDRRPGGEVRRFDVPPMS